MYKLVTSVVALQLLTVAVIAQPAPPSLSLDQQTKISEIVTNRTPQPLTHIDFVLQRDATVPAAVRIERLPVDAESVAPELSGYSYLAVEELVAIVDTNSRKVVSVMQRMRRQQSTGSGN
jgi:hypothetical protein